MPVPFRKRKRQPHERIARRQADDPTAAVSEGAKTEEEESSHDDPTQARNTQRGASFGEYRPL